MAARRLLIVMLVLLGLSTLAAALVPQHSLRGGGTSATTTTQPTTTSTTNGTRSGPSPAFLKPTTITVGGEQFPVVSPLPVGQQVVLLVRSKTPTQLEIPEFGQFGFAAPNAPARFDLLPTVPGRFGIVFATSGKVAAQLRVIAPRGKKQKKKGKKT